MRHSKPPQPIYRPGSGPLRKSVGQGDEPSNVDVSRAEEISSEQRNRNETNSRPKYEQKRSTKQDQQFYQPKPVAQALADRGAAHGGARTARTLSPDPATTADQDKRNEYNRPKRYSTSRNKNFNDGGNHEFNRAPPYSQRDQTRQRQQSEPRIFAHDTYLFHRDRDTRSVEPVGRNKTPFNKNKSQNKPPTGRRHSIGLDMGKPHKTVPNLDSLPPRLRKKYLIDHNIDPNFTGKLEDVWDNNKNSRNGSGDAFDPYKHNNSSTTDFNNFYGSKSAWSTVPKTRGRGRLRRDSDTDTNLIGNDIRQLSTFELNLPSPRSNSPYSMSPRNTNHFPTQDRTLGLNSNNNVDNTVEQATSSQLDRDSVLDRPETPKTSCDSLHREENDLLDWSLDVEQSEMLNQKLHGTKSAVVPKSENVQQPSSGCRPRRNKPAFEKNWHREQGPDNWSSDYRDTRGGRGGRSRNQSNDDKYRTRRNSYREKSNERRRQRSQNSSRNSSIDKNYRSGSHENETENWRNEIKQSTHDEKPALKLELTSESGEFEFENLDKIPSLCFNKTDSETDFVFKSPQVKCKKMHSQDNINRSDSSQDDYRETMKFSPTKSKSSSQCDTKRNQTPGLITLPTDTVATFPDSLEQRTLYDPNNPSQPILVTASNARKLNASKTPSKHDGESSTTNHFDSRSNRNVAPKRDPPPAAPPAEIPTTTTCLVQFTDPDTNSRNQSFRKHLMEVKKIEQELHNLMVSKLLIPNWHTKVHIIRSFLHDSLEYFLTKDIKYMYTENLDYYFWNMLYHSIIEMLRTLMVEDFENRVQHKALINELVAEGTTFYEKLLHALETIYNFNVNDNMVQPSPAELLLDTSNLTNNLGYSSLVANKIYVCLGDLARYKEMLSETSNFGKSKQLYLKAIECNPKNARPYHQIALLSNYHRRRLDAVYYFMRSLMAPNPIPSSRESLIQIFDENRKKFEQIDRKRREEKAKLQMKEKELLKHIDSLRREFWIHPDGGPRFHLTVSASPNTPMDSDEEELEQLTSVEINKRFVISYLHVIGKLISRVGIESFKPVTLQMLREFRTMLQQTPVPFTCTRLIHLLALNMYTIDCTQLRDPELEMSCRSEMQERALIVSMQMFSILLERCIFLIQEDVREQQARQRATPDVEQYTIINPDLQVLLPPIKIWCDWMFYHSSIWNPPPSCADYNVGPSTSDTWNRLAALMNWLDKIKFQVPTFYKRSNLPEGKTHLVRLPEDGILSGFAPLMYESQESQYVCEGIDLEMAQMILRVNRIMFFGTKYLCGLEPPVLKLHKYENHNEYVSAVRFASRRDSTSSTSDVNLSVEDFAMESYSEDSDDDEKEDEVDETTTVLDPDTRELLQRRRELMKVAKRQAAAERERNQAIKEQARVSVEIVVRPRKLILDTNCYIEHLDKIKKIVRANTGSYMILVPVVVLGELEGLAKGNQNKPPDRRRATMTPEEDLKVTTAAKESLKFLHGRQNMVRCLTTHGTIISSFSFSHEEDAQCFGDCRPRNDDRILTACLAMCKDMPDRTGDERSNGPRRIYREVVLLTEDRNLRVKALSRDLPVRDLPAFLKWAALG